MSPEPATTPAPRPKMEARKLQIAYGEKVAVKDVVLTNRVHVGVAVDGRAGLALATSAIDNLVKGAAGQAVQSMNAVMGWPETDGLDLLGG